MELFLSTGIDGLQMGLCFAILAMGVYISYSVLDFPDLSVDGTFPLGGITATILMLRAGFDPVVAIFVSFFAGFAVGALTGVLHVKLKITNLLSGIIVMTGLLSVTLAMTKLITKNGLTTTIFSFRSEKLSGAFGDLPATGAAKDWMIIGILVLFVTAAKILIDLFMKTKLGYMLKATGSNEKLVVSLGKDPGMYKILGLAAANGLVSVSGAVWANLYSQYDNTCGSGKVVLALASVIIGISVFSRIKVFKDTTSVICGAIVYSLCLNYLALLDKNGIYLKLFNAVMFTLILVFNKKIKTNMKKYTREKTEAEK